MVNLIFTFLLFFSTINAQQLVIKGFVVDAESNAKLIGANVLLEGTSNGSATDAGGKFSIKNVSPGKYSIMVSYMGYTTFKDSIIISSDYSGEKEIRLEREAIQMDTYVVTASRRRERVEDAPAAISVISKKEIRRESNANLGDYLKGTKGIDFTQSGIDSYNMTARGFNSSLSSRLLTLMDGRMANVPSLRLTAYNVIPVSFEDVEQIEVVLGPSSALYGPNAHSGVLNIVTSSPLKTQGTSINFQGGLLNQTDTDLLKKLTVRTAHRVGNFGFKVSGVALSGQDWTHFNSDEYEGHDPVFIGRPNLRKDNIDIGGMASGGNPLFTADMLLAVDGSDESWIGESWADKISEYGEDGSPVITQEMVDAAESDEFNRLTLDNGITLWFVTEDKLGYAYADGVDNNFDGSIDESIDTRVDDIDEIWYDGVDNDNDGLIDELDEISLRWLNRFDRFYEGAPSGNDDRSGFGFGNYEYDAEGNILFDTNNNNVFNDNWGSDGLDNDNDWGPYVDSNGNPSDVAEESFIDLDGDGLFGPSVREFFIDSDGNGVWTGAEPFTDANGNGLYDAGEDFTDIDGSNGYTTQEFFSDNGLDGLAGTSDYGEDDGAWNGETFEDLNGNNEWDQYTYNDFDNNNLPSIGEVGVDEFDEKDFVMNYGNQSKVYKDANDDGINDYPDFKVRNYRYDVRMDWEPNNDFTAVLSHGYAFARNINVTGIARYLADGWVYRYYQARLRYKNLFFQTYLNSTFSGDLDHPTRNLANGSLIYDRSKKFSAQLQHVNEWLDGDLRFVWGIDYFLTTPDTRGTVLSDRNLVDNKDNNGTGEAGSPIDFADSNNDLWYNAGEPFAGWSTENGLATGTPLDSIGVDSFGNTLYADSVYGAFSDGLDNDGDSDDYADINGDGIPNYIDTNGDGIYNIGESLEPGVTWLGNQRFGVYADGLDNDGDGKKDENIDEGIDEKKEGNGYNVNELGAYYQLNWKINPKWEFIQATRVDAHDRLTNFVEFNNQEYGANYSPLNWKFNFDKTDGLQVSPKLGIVYRPKENQNFRLTWATAFNTPSNQALFLDIYITNVAIFKVFAKGSEGGYNFPRDNQGRVSYFNTDSLGYSKYKPEKSVMFYPSTDPRVEGFYSSNVSDLPELEPEIVKTWEFGYKGRLNERLFGTLDVYSSHYSSFVSPATFITPIVIDKAVVETDYNKNGITNRIEDIDNNIIADSDDYDTSFDNWRDNIQGVTAMDTVAGLAPPVVIGYINYGEVDLWGFDASATYFLSREINLDLTYSYLGMTEFVNPVTNNKDPINAPRHKIGTKFQYTPKRYPFTASLNARYVDGFNWSSGIYYGAIRPYTIFDFHLGYEVTKNVKINLTINNLLGHVHTEIIGGPALGRVSLLRLQTSF